MDEKKLKKQFKELLDAQTQPDRRILDKARVELVERRERTVKGYTRRYPIFVVASCVAVLVLVAFVGIIMGTTDRLMSNVADDSNDVEDRENSLFVLSAMYDVAYLDKLDVSKNTFLITVGDSVQSVTALYDNSASNSLISATDATVRFGSNTDTLHIIFDRNDNPEVLDGLQPYNSPETFGYYVLASETEADGVYYTNAYICLNSTKHLYVSIVSDSINRLAVYLPDIVNCL